jgi:hypothetical protein
MSNQTKNTRELDRSLNDPLTELLPDLTDVQHIKLKQFIVEKLTQTKQETIQACKDALPKRESSAFNPNSSSIDLEKAKLMRELGWNEYADTAHAAFDKLKGE